MQKKFFWENYVYIKIFFVFKKYFVVKLTMAGISNQNILNFIEEKTNDDIKNNFVGIFPLNFIICLL